jgi:hypothetical protein
VRTRPLALPTITAAALLAALAWEKHDLDRAVLDVQVRRVVADLIRGAAQVDALALSAATGNLPAYDPLERALGDLRTAARGLEALDATLAREASLELFTAALAARTDQVERLKTRRAALSNTETHLPELLEELRARGPADASVEHAMLGFALARSKARRDRLEDARKVMEPASPLAPHIDVLLSDGYGLELLLHDLLRAPLAAHAAKLKDRYAAPLNARAERVRTVRVAGLLIAMLCCLAIMVLQRRL